MSQERTVWLPWNSFYAMDTLVMKTEENSIPSCDLSGFVRPDPIIISSPLSTFFSAAPGQNPIVPETQVGMAGTRVGLFKSYPIPNWLANFLSPYLTLWVGQRLILRERDKK